jgi:PAS domain S-box-containing protein
LFVAGGAMIIGLVEALHAARRRAEANERWLSAVLSSIGDAVIATDGQGRVCFANQVARTLTGWGDEGATGKPLEDVFAIVSEDDHRPVENPVTRVLREGVVVGLANHTLLIHRDGTERPIHDSAAPILDHGGRIIGVVLVFRDDTERRDQERGLIEANRRKDEFLAMLAHELRNPLAAIRTAVEILDMPGSDDHAEWTKGVLNRQVNLLAHLLDDLLDVSRITRGMIQVRRERIDAYPVINHAIESVRPLIDDRNHRFEAAISASPLRLEADPVRLEQVLVNLLNNAAKYTPSGGTIKFTVAREGDEIVFRVVDSGLGIPAEDLPRIFDLFTQTKRTLDRSEGGLGVGLTIVKRLVELHGGSVSASSGGPGLGSVFVVRFPADEGPPAPSASSPREAGRRERARILIVDDNKELARGLGKLLRLLGHEVEMAHDGPEGIEAARASRPEVILLDIGLPNLDGYHVARTLREEEAFRDTLIVAISGYGQDEDRRRSLEAGMDHHLTKPVDIRTIAEIITQSI